MDSFRRGKTFPYSNYNYLGTIKQHIEFYGH